MYWLNKCITLWDVGSSISVTLSVINRHDNILPVQSMYFGNIYLIYVYTYNTIYNIYVISPDNRETC